MPGFSRNNIVYFSESVIDGTQTGVTSVTTTLDDEYPPFHPMIAAAIIEEEESVLTPCVISIGTNNPDYNNIVNSKMVGGALGLTLLDLAPNAPTISPESEIKCKVNVACIPQLLQTPILNFKVAVHGFDVEF